MTQALLSISVAMIAGLLMSRIAKLLKLPAVTSYLVAGIVVGPYCLGMLGINGLGFATNADVKALNVFSEVALGFIAFTIGNEFRLKQLKKIGKKATVIAFAEALTASLFVTLALLILHFIIPDKLSMPVVLTLGAMAAATAPAATLMVVRQYKAKGKVTDLLLPIVALDDAIALMVFAIMFGIAKSMGSGHFDFISIVINPLIEIVASLGLGFVAGVIFNYAERIFSSNSKRLSLTITFVILTAALSMLEFDIGPVHIGFSTLLVCMMLGTVFCNMCDFSEDMMQRTDKWTAPLFVLFFVLNGADLELNIFADIAIVGIGAVYIISRCIGKYTGAFSGSKLTKCESEVSKYLGITLFPQAGVAIGMSITAAEQLGADGSLVRNIALFSVLIYELVGPLLTKIALTKSGDINLKPVQLKRHDTIKSNEQLDIENNK